jgi:phosphoglucosamine mutase
LKFFSGDGTKLPDEVEEEIERWLDMDFKTVSSDELGKVERAKDAAGRYIEFCKRALPNSVSLKGLRIVVDCANGATYHVAPDVFGELGAEVIAIGNTPDGININEACGATHVDGLCDAVLRYRADLGIALDGDGDRLIMVDQCGDTVDGDEILAIIAHHRHAEGKLHGGVVGTLMSNLGLEKSIQALGVPFYRAKVGDRYVIEQMTQHDCDLGGESSGHIIVRNFITTGDGIIAALQVLRAMRMSGKPLHELKSVMAKYPQTLINVPTKHKINLDESIEIQDAVRQVEQQLGNRGRVLLRASGTEPLIRVMVEGEDPHETAELAEQIASAVRAAA